MVKKSKKINNIAELLPDGLTEETVTKIADLVSDVIKEKVKDEITILEAKVTAFLRANIDSMKEQAIKELEEENPVYRKAQMFESIRAQMSIELTGDDESHAAHNLVVENSNLLEEKEILTREVNNVILENTKKDTLIEALTKKVENLSSDKEKLSDAVKSLKEHVKKPFQSSEQALKLSKSKDAQLKESAEKSKNFNGNPYLTSEIMKLVN